MLQKVARWSVLMCERYCDLLINFSQSLFTHWRGWKLQRFSWSWRPSKSTSLSQPSSANLQLCFIFDTILSAIRFREFPMKVRHWGHSSSRGLQSLQMMWPLSHWNIGVSRGICRQTGHSMSFRTSSGRFIFRCCLFEMLDAIENNADYHAPNNALFSIYGV